MNVTTGQTYLDPVCLSLVLTVGRENQCHKMFVTDIGDWLHHSRGRHVAADLHEVNHI